MAEKQQAATSSWSLWGSTSGGGAADSAEKHAKQAAEKQAKQDKMVDDLRARLSTSEGATAAAQLVKGGELAAAEEMTADAYLRRWLAAREWDVDLAQKCIVRHAGWREHMVPAGYMPESKVSNYVARGIVSLQGTDRQGRALMVVHVANNLTKERDLAELKLFTCYTIDAMLAACDTSINPGRRLVSVFDLTGASMANMDIAGIKLVLGLLGTHYVERLAVMYFYNPPYLFWGLWNSLKGLLPEVTRNKLKVIDPSDLSELTDAVAADVLPVEYGGTAARLPVHEAIRRFKLPPFDRAGFDAAADDDAGAAVAAAAGDEDDDAFVDATSDDPAAELEALALCESAEAEGKVVAGGGAGVPAGERVIVQA